LQDKVNRYGTSRMSFVPVVAVDYSLAVIGGDKILI